MGLISNVAVFILYPGDYYRLHECITKLQCDGLEKTASSGARLLRQSSLFLLFLPSSSSASSSLEDWQSL